MTKKEKDFIKKVWAYYRAHGRHTLPWRKTRNAYRILVSEVMLQQTGVDRVVPKYHSFLREFPSVASLARAPCGDVFRTWLGLGYNRRAKMLHECAKEIINNRNGRMPKTFEELAEFPGVGPYTAGAVMAFAYNIPVPIIETNIRTVFIHHFFPNETDVNDGDIIRYVERTLDRKNPRKWYCALMDYGAYLKETIGNENTRSRHYTKQSIYKNSDRQIRGAVLRTLTSGGRTIKALHRELPFDGQRIDEQVEKLLGEGMISSRASRYYLPN